MLKIELKKKLKSIHGITIKKFLENHGYHGNHLARYSDEKKIPNIITIIYENFELKKEIKSKEIELNTIHNINQSLYEINLKNIIVEDPTFIPTIGCWCYFWNNNSEIIVIAKYSHSIIKDGSNQKIHYIKNDFYKKGFTKMAEYKDTLPKEFFIQHYHIKRDKNEYTRKF